MFYSKSIQLIAGKTAQEFNSRKGRNGAFWQDRYHATAISNDSHLVQCMTYIDLNMVRAGIVSHPRDWLTCGYHEIHHFKNKKRYLILDLKELMEIFNLNSIQQLKQQQNKWIEFYMKDANMLYDEKWSQSIAVGNQLFVDEVANKLGKKAKYREKKGMGDSFVLKG